MTDQWRYSPHTARRRKVAAALLIAVGCIVLVATVTCLMVGVPRFTAWVSHLSG